MLNIPEEVKELLYQDGIRKNFRIHFPNEELDDINNDRIISESVSIKESICSNSNLEYGLCEQSSIYFSVIGLENINGKEIECFLDIDVSELENFVEAETRADLEYKYYPIPYGRYIVDSSKKQSNMDIRNIVAYSSDINSAKVIVSDFEKAKIEARYKTNSALSYSPAQYAFATVFNSIPVNLTQFDKTESTTLFNTENKYLGSRSKSSESIQINLSVKRAYLRDMTSHDGLWAIEKGFTTMQLEAIENAIRNAVATLNNSIQFSDRQIKYMSKKAFVANLYIQNYIYASKTYAGSTTELKDGIEYVTPYWQEENSDYKSYIDIPIKLTVKNLKTEQTVDIALRDENSIHAYKIDTSKIISSKIFKATASVSRLKTSTKEYAAVISDMPDAMSIFKDILSLSAMFCIPDRETGYNKFKTLSPKSEVVLYPGYDTFPNITTFPSGNGNIHEYTPSEYSNFWYDDFTTKPYTAIQCKYTDTNGNESVALCENVPTSRVLDLKEVYDKSTEYTFTLGDEDSDTFPKINAEEYIYIKGKIKKVTFYNSSDTEVYSTSYFDTNYMEYIVTFNGIDTVTKVKLEFDGTNERIVLGITYGKSDDYKLLEISANSIFSIIKISDDDMNTILEYMMDKIKDVRYMPISLTARGYPFVEIGDYVIVNTLDGSQIESYVLERTLSGINYLSDEITAN